MKGYVLIGHGPLPQAFKESVQMIAGEMENLYAICLLPDEGIEQLTKKIDRLMLKVSSYKEILIFVDLHGGTPANVVFQMFAENEKVNVITGMNFPVVLTALLSPSQSVEELIEVGQEGIKNLKAKGNDTKRRDSEDISAPITKKMGKPKVIKNVRVDARGIHGQVATAWVPHLSVNRIIVIDDQAVKDTTQKMALKMAKPNSVKLSILSTKTAVERLNDPLAYQDEDVLVLIQRVETLMTMKENGYQFTDVNLGNIPSRDGTKKYRNTIHLTTEEALIIESLIDEGTVFTAQMVPNDTKVDFSNVINSKK